MRTRIVTVCAKEALNLIAGVASSEPHGLPTHFTDKGKGSRVISPVTQVCPKAYLVRQMAPQMIDTKGDFSFPARGLFWEGGHPQQGLMGVGAERHGRRLSSLTASSLRRDQANPGKLPEVRVQRV